MIKEYINNVAKYYVPLNLGKSFESIISEGKEDKILIVPYSILMDSWSMSDLFEKYYICVMYDLANFLLGSYNEGYMLWHISMNKPEKIKMSVYFDFAHPYRDVAGDGKLLRVSDKFENNYLEYLEALEEWSVEEKKTEDKKNLFEFIVLSHIIVNRIRRYAIC